MNTTMTSCSEAELIMQNMANSYNNLNLHWRSLLCRVPFLPQPFILLNWERLFCEWECDLPLFCTPPPHCPSVHLFFQLHYNAGTKGWEKLKTNWSYRCASLSYKCNSRYHEVNGSTVKSHEVLQSSKTKCRTFWPTIDVSLCWNCHTCGRRPRWRPSRVLIDSRCLCVGYVIVKCQYIKLQNWF